MKVTHSTPNDKPRTKGRRPAWPRVRHIGDTWQVDTGRVRLKDLDGKRVRLKFATSKEADAQADEWRATRAAEAAEASFEAGNRAVSLSALSDSGRRDVLAALERLAGRGTLLQAADFYMLHAAPANAATVEQVFNELTEAVRLANRRPRTVYELKNKLAGVVTELGEQPVARITTQDVEKWLTEKGLALSSPRSRAAYRQALHRLFSFAVKRGYRTSNPVAAIDKPQADETRPEILKPVQVRKLLAKAKEIAPDLVPFLALAFFSGLRTAELQALDWKHIDLAAGQIFVDPATAKKRRARYVKIEPNLAALLAQHVKEDGPVYYSRRALRLVQEKSGVDIPHNGARHSFGSYHLAAFEDAGRTAAQLGHAEDASVLFNHYRALVRPEAASDYWKIKPDEQGKVIRLHA